MQVIPLGGCGEFGRNVTACIASAGALLIDCGLQLPDDLSPGVDRFVPDLRAFLARHQPDALLLTHGHDDHIGAVPYLLRLLDRPLPVYGRRLTLRLLEQLLRDQRIPARLRDLRQVELGQVLQIGAMTITPFSVPHSIPEACAVLVEGDGRSVLHTGDLKLDGVPEGIARLPGGDARVDLLISDSTNAVREGRSGTEEGVADALAEVLAAAPGRVVVGLFSSHIERIAHFASSCVRGGRRLCVLGRGLAETLDAAAAAGVLRLPHALLCTEREALRLPPRQVALLCTGSQGEPEAALARLAHQLGSGDTVVFSARALPGCERAVQRLGDRLARRGVRVLIGPAFAASGHAAREELREILRRVRPRALLPVHGGARQLRAHAELAAEEGVPALVCENGDVIDLGEPLAVIEHIPCGRLAMEGTTIGQVGQETLTQRQRIGRSGVVMVALQGRTAQVRAVGVCDEGAALEALCADAARAAAAAAGEPGDPAEAARRAVRRTFHRARGVRPTVVVLNCAACPADAP